MPFSADIIYYDSSGREQCSRIAPDTEWIWQDGRVENPRIGIELSWYWSGDTLTVPLEALYESGAGRLKDLILLPDFLAGNEGDGQSLILPYGCGALVHTKGHRRGEMMIGGSSPGWRSHERFRHHQRSSNKSNVRRGGRYDMLFRLRTCFGPERLYAPAPVFRVRDHAADSPLSDRISLHLGDFDGDYAAMAHWYGDYMRRHYAIRPLRETAGKSPLMEYGSRAIAMRVRLACKQMPSPIHEQTHDHQPELNVFMTFENVRMTLEECRKQNVGPLDCSLVGWNCGGHDGAYPQLFPVEERIGGESERKKTLETAKELGSRIGLHDNYFDSYTIADSFRWENVNRNADQLPSLSGIWGGGQSYIVCPKHSYENARRNLRQTPALGINGFYFIDVLTVWPLEKCCSKAHPLTRRTCAIGRKKNLKYVHDLFGGIMSEGGRDWALPELDRIYDLLDTLNMPDRRDAEIPLYQMVWHGTVIYNPAGPHTVGYLSLYRDYPEDARNRVWNSSFENGIAHWHLEVSGGKKTLPEFDKTFQIVKGKGIHGNSYLQVSRPDGEANHVRISTMPVQIQDGKDYIFSFYAKASKDGETILCNGLKIRLSTTWKRYVLPLTSIKPETYSWSGMCFPNRRTFSAHHQGNASILPDAVQLEQGRKATEFEYPEMVLLSVRPANRLGLYLPNEKPEVQWTLFNGYPEERRGTVILRIRDFAHRPVKTMTFHRTLAAGAGITELVPMPAGYRPCKEKAELQTRNGNRQTVDTAVSVVKDRTAVPGRDFFGQLEAAGRNPGNFADGLRLHQLLGVRNLLVYNNLRLDWETVWRTSRSYPEQRNLLIDRIRAAGFEPELAIKPLGKFNRDPYGVEIVGPEELEEIRARMENFARTHRHNLKHYEVFGEYMQGYLPPRARNVAAILPVVYYALKKTSPSCLVDAFAEDNIPGIEAELEARFKLGSLQYADRVTILPYWIARQNQEGLDTGLKQVRNLVNRYAKQKPIAANESGHRAVDTLYYDDIEPESMYYALYCTEVEQAERSAAEHLVWMIEENGFRADCGMFGSRHVPEALVRFGFPGHWIRLLTQPEIPGYAAMLRMNGSTLEKQWKCNESDNHPVLGGFDGVLYEYLAGIQLDEGQPGSRCSRLSPKPSVLLGSVSAFHRMESGELRVDWEIKNGMFELTAALPPDCSTVLELPDGREKKFFGAATRHCTCRLSEEKQEKHMEFSKCSGFIPVIRACL